MSEQPFPNHMQRPFTEREAVALATSLRHYYGARLSEVVVMHIPTPTVFVVVAWPPNPDKPVLCALGDSLQTIRFLGYLFRYFGSVPLGAQLDAPVYDPREAARSAQEGHSDDETTLQHDTRDRATAGGADPSGHERG